MNSASPRKRGRPPKFGRPTQFVALTLPRAVIEGLRKINRDLAWAIVSLVEKPGRPPARDETLHDTELLSIAGRRSLIVVNRGVFASLPGVQIIPVDRERAFLALDAGRGLADLELAVIDRLEDSVPARERKALKILRTRLREWRLDPSLRIHTRAIIVVEHRTRRPR